MSPILEASFFQRPTLTVAEELLGKFLVRKTSEGILAGMITEVEAYDGPLDKACHAHRGKTPRNAPMFGSGGFFYVYFVYGMHWMLNVVTGEEDYPAAVLIRGVGEWNGPGKLTKAFSIEKALNAAPVEKKSGLWIEDRRALLSSKDIHRTPRIGVAYAGAWAKKPYRFVLMLSI